MSTTLANRECVPCSGDTPPLGQERIDELLGQLDDHWAAEEGHHLTRTFKLKNFARALELTNRIGAIAEEQNHHPDIHLGWGKVRVEILTHAIDGLTESDFILAAKIDEAFEAFKGETA